MDKYKIVIVENDPDEQFFMKEGFEASGLFEILAQVKNGDHLFLWMRENNSIKPDLILSDLNMPGKNGYDIITEMKTNAAFGHVPVVITSTSPAQSIIEKCLKLGAADYIIKPETFIAYAPFAEDLHERLRTKILK